MPEQDARWRSSRSGLRVVAKGGSGSNKLHCGIGSTKLHAELVFLSAASSITGRRRVLRAGCADTQDDKVTRSSFAASYGHATGVKGAVDIELQCTPRGGRLRWYQQRREPTLPHRTREGWGNLLKEVMLRKSDPKGTGQSTVMKNAGHSERVPGSKRVEFLFFLRDLGDFILGQHAVVDSHVVEVSLEAVR